MNLYNYYIYEEKTNTLVNKVSFVVSIIEHIKNILKGRYILFGKIQKVFLSFLYEKIFKNNVENE